MRLISVLALRVISAAIGHWEDAVFLLLPKHPETVEATKPSASEEKKVEVLGDRVRCDVRFTELGLPVSEYRSFFDKCVGGPAPSD
jgi:hypothetical protein